MKLHLPHGLRKALLACLAALTVSLPATLGSASGVAAVTIALSALTAQQTAAEDVTVTTTGEWEAFINGDKNTPPDAATGSRNSLIFDGTGGINFPESAKTSPLTLYADLVLSKNLTINDGYSGNEDSYATYIFSGAVTGSGNFSFTKGTVHRQKWVFTGDMSKWTGNITVANGAGDGHALEFSGDGFVSSAGTITLTTADSTLLVNGVELKNASITATKLEIQNAVTFSGRTVTVTGATTVVQGATLTLGTNTEMHLASMAENSTLTMLTLGEGSELGLGGGVLNIGTLVLSGGNASLAMDATGNAHITLTNFTDGGHKLTIYLTGLTDELIGESGYDIFGGTWNSAWADKIIVENDGREVKLNEQGKVAWMYELQDLKWTGGNGSNTLAWTDGGSGWDNNGTFHNGDNVTLTGSGSAALQVNVTGDILTGNLIISGDTTGGFVFAAGGEGGSLTVGGNLDISANATFNMEATVDGTTTFGASNGGQITLGANSTVDLQGAVSGTLGTLNMGDGSRLTVGATSGDTPFTLGSIDTSAATTTGATLALGQNASVTVTGENTAGSGVGLKVDMEAGATLTLKANTTLGGINGANANARHITGQKEGGGNITLTFDNATGADDSLVHVEVSGVDIVKTGEGSQNLSMKFSGGSITVQEGTLSTIGGQHWSTLDATSVTIAEGATFFWGDSVNGDGQVHGHVSGDVDIRGTFEIQDSINLTKGATIGESGKIITQWGAQISLGADLIINHASNVFENGGYGIATLKKGDFEGAAEHVHLQLGGENQEYSIKDGKWSDAINVDGSLGLYWKGNGGQLRIEGSTFDEVLVGGSGKLWFQGQATLNGELKDAEGYEGEANVFVHNTDNARLTLKVGGTLKSVLNGGWGTYIDLGADFEVGGLQLQDVNGGPQDDGFYNKEFKFAKAADAEEDVTLRLNVTSDVTLENTLTLDEGVNLVKEGSATQTITGLLTVGGNVTVNAGTLALTAGATVGGHLSAANGTITLGADSRMMLQSGADNSLGTLTLNGNATLGLTVTDGSSPLLTLGTLNLGEYTLTLDLGAGLGQYLVQQGGSATLDIFGSDSDVAQALKAAKDASRLVLVEDYGYSWDVDDQGRLVFTGTLPTVTWSEGQHQEKSLIWENDNGEGRWDGGGNFSEWSEVELIGNSETNKTITLKGEAIQATSVTISGGTGKFVFGSEENGSLEAIDITVGVSTDFNAGVSVAGSLTVQDGVTVNVGDSGSLQMQDGAGITVGNGSNLVIAANKLSHGGEVLQFTYSGGDVGSGEVEIKMKGGQRITGLNAAKGVTLKLTNTEGYSFFQDITAAGEVIVAGAQVILDGTNSLASLSDGNTALTDRFVLVDAHKSTTLTGDMNLSNTALDMRAGELVVESGTITVGKGVYTFSGDGGHIKGREMVTTIEDAAKTQTYNGALTLSGNLTKRGAGTQELRGGSDNELSVKGTVTVEAGALNWGKADLASSIGTLAVSGGTFKLRGGTLTVGSITSLTNLALGETTTPAEGQAVTTTGNLTVKTEGFTISGGWTWVNGSSLTLGGSLQAITLGGEGWTEKLAAALGGAGNQKLTVTLGADFLTGASGNSFTLFSGGGVADFTQYFNVDFSALSSYEGLTFKADGTLTWGGGGSVEPPPDGLVWNTANSDNTWGGGHNNWGENNQAWVSGSDAVFNDDTGEEVTIEGTVTAGNVSVVKGTWTFAGDGSLSASGLTLQGEGTSVTFTGNRNMNMGVITLGAGTKLILQGAQTWAGTNDWNNYATGEGEVVFMGMGKQEVKVADGGGILWAFTSNKEEEGHDLGSLRLSTWKGGGEGGADAHTTLYITGEMGGNEVHGVANIANIWVDDGNSLVLGTAALGEPRNGRHQNNTLHLAGNGSNDAYADGQSADAALMLVGENSTHNRRLIKWNIDVTADTSISVTDAAETAPKSGQQYWTLGGKMYNSGKTVEKKGNEKLILGADFTTAVNAEGGDGSGTWKVSAGTLELAYTAADTMSGWTVELASGGTLATTKDATLKALSGTGTLNVGGGTLTVGTAEGANLTNLTLTGSLTVSAGSFTISGGWTWGAGSKLTLGGQGQVITLGEGLSITGGGADTRLTIELSTSFLEGGDGTEGVELFSGFKEEYVDYFEVVLTDDDGTYAGLTLGADGRLTWGEDPGATQTWKEGGNEFTWNAGSNTWTVDGTGGQTFSAERNVVFAGTNAGTITVKVSGAIDIGGNYMRVTKGEGAAGDQSYVFRLDEAADSLRVGMLTVASDVTAEFKVKAEATTGVVASKTTVNGTLVFGGSNTDGYTGKRNFGDVTVNEGGKVVVRQGWNVEGNHVSGNGTLVFDWAGAEAQQVGNAFQIMVSSTETLANAEVAEGTSLMLHPGDGTGSAEGYKTALRHVTNLKVDDGANLTVSDAAAIAETATNVHLAGTGVNDEGALAVTEEGDVAMGWGITLDEDATMSNVGNTTLTGALDAATHTLTKKGAGDLVLGEGFSTKAESSGILNVTEGALKLNYGTSEALSAYTVQLAEGATLESSITGTVGKLSGTGALNVSGGALTVGTAEGATLTDLALGAGETAGSLVVNGGGFAVSEGWTWGTGSRLTLGGSLQKIELRGTGWADRLAANGSKLTITLGGTFLNGVDGNSFALFSGGGVTDFTQYFDVDLSALSTAYEGLAFNEDGTLSWGEVVGPVEPGPGGDEEPGEDVYWGGGEGESDLTWGNTGNNEGFDTDPEGGGDVGWQDGRNVHFLGKGGDKPRNVKLAGDIKTGAFDATGTEGQAEFSFGSEGKKYLTVGGTMTVTRAKLTFTKDIDLTVEGSVTLKDSDSTLSVEGVAEFKGKVGGTGTLDTGTEGKISLSRTEEGGFKGRVTGTGTLATAESGQVTLAGDVSGFGGTLDIGTGGTLTLSGAAVGDEVKVKAGGSGTLAVDGGETDVTFTGIVGGTGLTLRNAGSGELIVTSQAEDNGGGTKLDGGKGGITLGGTGKATVWSGTAVTGGDITLSNVTLAKGGLTNKASGAKVYVDTALAAGINAVAREATPQGGIVDVKGMDAGKLDGITVNAHGQLTGVTGTYTVGADKQLALHFTEENVSGDAGDADSQVLIVGAEGGHFALDASSKTDVTLELTEATASILDMLSEQSGGEVYVHVLRGGTLGMGELTLSDFGGLDIFESVVKGFAATVEGGDIKLTGTVEDVYVVDGGETVDAVVPGRMKAIVFGQGKRATFTTESEATLHNLLGASGSVAQLQKGAGATGEVTFTLDNTFAGDITHADTYPEVEGSSVRGQNTVFLGSIVGGKGVNIVKSGLGILTVGGNYTLADGDTRVEAGALRLRGVGNRMKSLTFAYGAAPSTGEAGKEERGLQLAAGSRTELGSIVEAADAVSTEGNEVKLTGNAELILTGKSAPTSTMITGDGNGTLELGTGAELSLNEEASIRGTAVEVGDNAVLDIGTTTGSTLTELNGSGTLKSATGGEVTVGGGTFTGTLGSSVEGAGAGTLVVTGEFILDKVASEGGAKMGVRLEGKSHLTVKAGEKQGDGTDTLNFGDIELGGGQLTVDFGGRGISEKYVTGNVIGVDEGGVLEFVSNGAVKGDTVNTGFTVVDGLRGQVDDFVKLTGVDSLLHDLIDVDVTDKGEVILTLRAVGENRLAGLIPGAQKNGLAGAEMMWGSLKGRSQGELLSEIFARPDSAYARLALHLVQCYESKNAAGLDRTLAAAAGSAISTLGAALGQDVHRQLSTIRNRTTGMGGAAHAASDKLPQWHAWIQGEGNYHKLDADGLAPGYTLNSWGGTVGVDADVTRRMTLGLAVTAMYGDLKPDSPDSATGDLDTAYLSAFARVAHGAWIHTFAVSGGFADVKLDRTVSYGGDSYRTSGSTDGYALGVLYEVGYTRLMNATGTVALQPVINVEWRHASIDGYTESGCDAGVNTDDITQDVVTFGAGARAQFAVGANAFNHAAILETRALVKADVGDRSGTANNAMVGDTARAEVESAEVGAVGVELGAGISVPVGTDTGSVFVDGSVEFRSGWTSANATVGYKMNF